MPILHTLKPKFGSKKRRKRLGTGSGSGHGQTSTRGQKGQNSTSGGTKRRGFEGGQTPLLRRIPKSGFNNMRFKKVYEWVNTNVLDRFFNDGDEITPQLLRSRRILRSNNPVKVLGTGEIRKRLIISAHAFSKSAKEKIEKAGGKATVIK